MEKNDLTYNQYFQAQTKIVYEYLQTHIATGSMVELATGVHHKCITWIKYNLENDGRLWEVRKDRCEVTGRQAWYLTTNPEFKPEDNQMKLFE